MGFWLFTVPSESDFSFGYHMCCVCLERACGQDCNVLIRNFFKPKRLYGDGILWGFHGRDLIKYLYGLLGRSLITVNVIFEQALKPCLLL